MHQTPRFDALGFAFRVLSEDPHLTRYVANLFAGLEASGPDGHRYAFCRRPSPEDPRCELTLDGQMMFVAATPELLLTSLVQHVNRQAVEGCPLVLLHAGAVQRDGVGVVLPGVMEAGKTTLVAGLVRAGLSYLTDEAVALERETRVIRPYPKPLTLDPGAWPLFPELEPRGDFATDDYKAHQWQVPPSAIRPDVVGRPCPVGVIVFPHYEPHADTVLARVGRAEALIELTKNTFKFKDHPRESLDVLADVVRGADCYHLTTGALDPAVAAVSRLVGIDSTTARVT